MVATDTTDYMVEVVLTQTITDIMLEHQLLMLILEKCLQIPQVVFVSNLQVDNVVVEHLQLVGPNIQEWAEQLHTLWVDPISFTVNTELEEWYRYHG